MPVPAPGERALEAARTALHATLQNHVKALSARWAPRLRAVVLGGSVARGEEAWLADGDEVLHLLSDVDLYAVVDGQGPLPPPPPAPARLGSRLDLGIVGPSHFATLGHSLPAHQLAAGVRVLYESGQPWERPDPASLGGDEVDPGDATWLAHNRMAEQLEAGWPGESTAASWAAWKLWQDLPLAFLAAWGEYHADRDQQRRALRALGPPLGEEAGEWLLAGLARLDQMASLRSLGPLSARDLHLGAGAGEWGREELLSWAWPFYRACLARPSGRAGAADALDVACSSGRPSPSDLRAITAWLRREPWWRRARKARNWDPLGPTGRPPWWRHSWSGVGPELAGAACAAAFAGLDNRPLLEAQGIEPGGNVVKDALGAWRSWHGGGNP